jgi:hypothetical protein
MALVQLNQYVPEVANHVSGCPTQVITFYMRKVFTDLCERTLCWRVDLPDITLSNGAVVYSMVPTIPETEVYIPIKARMRDNVSDVTYELPIGTYEGVLASYPDHPAANGGIPAVVFCPQPNQVAVAPMPQVGTTYTLKLNVAIRPALTASTVESSIFEQFRRAIFHGTLHELMSLPERGWSNTDLAGFHGKQWEYFLYNARARANKGFTRSNLYVAQQPWA